MNHPIMLKTLQSPTQKDFVLIFQFLYGRIDPNYKFTRSIETEVFALLKTLNYPYLDGINRSSISAVGGQNWPSFLGMLYWLVKLNLALSNLNEDYFIAPDDVFDRVFIKYIISSYRAFIDQKEDYSDFYEEMKRGFESANSEVLQEVQSKKEAEKLLRQEFDLLNRQYREVEEAEAKSKALENDLRQFSEYMVKMKERQSKWGEILQQMETEITNAENQLKALEMEKKTYENSIINKGYTIADIDKSNQERDKLSKSIDAVSNKIEDARENLQRSDSHLRQSFQSLESFVNQYNLMTHKISSDDSFRLTLNSSLIEDDTKGYDYEQVLNRPLREEKIRLLSRRTELNQEVHNIQEECIKIVEQVDQYSEKIFDQQEEIESLEATVAKNKSTQEEIYETMVSEGTSYSAQIEKLDRELQGLQINVNKGIIEAETRHKNLKIAYQEWKYHIKEQREVLHDSVQRLIDYIISFKLNVQENIEELDALTLKELEHEQGLEGSISE
ncbi:putative kinetochore protein [Clavispora lusitaniae]|nr:putative kinetochore protein [Clavispora lusitaniae]